ncbi:MAG: hypothetical protein HKN10_18180 [Myxococcales bacterium]|nr:hypothetical protein [Myxococcales bacterium]
MITAVVVALTLAFFRIAERTSEPDAKQVLLVFAFIAITGSVANLLTGISAFFAYVSVLREAKRGYYPWCTYLISSNVRSRAGQESRSRIRFLGPRQNRRKR